MDYTKNTKHNKLKTAVLSLIGSSHYQIGDKFLPELELCTKLDVSRAALRTVLEELQEEGYIKRIQGSGTVILKKRTKYTLDLTVLGSADEMISGYEDLSTGYFKIFETAATSEFAGLLKVGEGESLLHIERVRTLDGIPAMYTRNVLAKDRIGYYENLYAEIANSLSKTMGWRVEKSDVIISICNAEEIQSERLRVSQGTQLLLIEEISRQQDGLPLDYSNDYYVADLFDFVMTRKRKKK